MAVGPETDKIIFSYLHVTRFSEPEKKWVRKFLCVRMSRSKSFNILDWDPQSADTIKFFRGEGV